MGANNFIRKPLSQRLLVERVNAMAPPQSHAINALNSRIIVLRSEDKMTINDIGPKPQ